MIVLLVLIVLILLFGPAKVKAWVGGASLAFGLVLAFSSGLIPGMLGDYRVWLVLGFCGMAAWWQGWDKSVEQFVGRDAGKSDT
ncbi:hypothetical protein [Shimia sp.]|uniref:hypothetical protein n=1 Tax=Shimia sp. TaxID=1954381 RepID=UPI0032986956